MNEDVAALLPETMLAGAAVVGLLAGSFLPRGRQWFVRALLGATCLAGLIATAVTIATGRTRLVFDDAFAVDAVTNAGRVIVLAGLLLVLCMSIPAVGGHRRETEFYVLLVLSAAGTLMMVGANDLLLLFAGYLLASVPAYALAGFAKDRLSTEAALKYYLIGALLSVFLLAGITLL